MSNSIIKTPIAHVWKDADGIIHIKLIEASEVDEFDILDLNLVVRNLSKQQPVLKLVDARCSWKISAKAKTKALEEDKLNKTIARAIIVSNSIKSTFFSFIKKFETTKCPQKYFTDINQAHLWLLEIKNNIA